jgi:hypothetical protein
MLEDKLLDEKTFKKIYAYRLELLLKNNRVKRKLARYDVHTGSFEKHRSWPEDDVGGWNGFQRLLERFDMLEMLKDPVPPLKKPPPNEPTS